MTAVLLVSAAAGTTCGLARLKVWALIPVTALLLIITLVEDSVTGAGVGKIALTFLLATTFLQLFYFIGSVPLEEHKRSASGSKPLRPDLTRGLQSAIGQEMRMCCPLPVELPPELDIRVAQLKVRWG